MGATVIIVYGLGFRDPLSGEWPGLARAKGTIQAVNGERLLLALEGRDSVQRIDLERIQGLDLAEAPSAGGAMEVVDTAAVRFARPQVEGAEPRRRAGGKLIAGMIGGLAGGFLGAHAGEGLDEDGLEGGLLGLATGYTVGTACGVSILDPHDRFISAVAGSVAGLLLGGWIAYASDNRWGLIVGPPVLATMASEMWRPERAEGIRLSAGPSCGLRGVSAGARVRF